MTSHRHVTWEVWQVLCYTATPNFLISDEINLFLYIWAYAICKLRFEKLIQRQDACATRSKCYKYEMKQERHLSRSGISIEDGRATVWFSFDEGKIWKPQLSYV